MQRWCNCSRKLTAPLVENDKSPAIRRDFLDSAYSIGYPTNRFNEQLATGLALLVGILAGTVRILLLLSGFLTTTLLAGLLSGLLAWGLILLARILVRIGHRDLPC